MKYSVTINNGKRSSVLASDDHIDIDVRDGNKYIARLTVRDGTVYNENDDDISTATGN